MFGGIFIPGEDDPGLRVPGAHAVNDRLEVLPGRLGRCPRSPSFAPSSRKKTSGLWLRTQSTRLRPPALVSPLRPAFTTRQGRCSASILAWIRAGIRLRVGVGEAVAGGQAVAKEHDGRSRACVGRPRCEPATPSPRASAMAMPDPAGSRSAWCSCVSVHGLTSRWTDSANLAFERIRAGQMPPRQTDDPVCAGGGPRVSWRAMPSQAMLRVSRLTKTYPTAAGPADRPPRGELRARGGREHGDRGAERKRQDDAPRASARARPRAGRLGRACRASGSTRSTRMRAPASATPASGSSSRTSS